MTDIEQRLRRIGQDTREEIGRWQPNPSLRRRIRARRAMVAAGTALSLLLLGVGGVYGASLMSTDDDRGRDVAAPPIDADFARFFSQLGADETYVVRVSPVAGTVCVSPIASDTGFRRLAIVRGLEEQKSIAEVFPGQHTFTEKSGDASCVKDLDHEALARVIEEPEQHFLLIDSPSRGQLVSSLVGHPSVDDNDACGWPLPFEATYVPPGFERRPREGSGGGAVGDMFIAHWRVKGGAFIDVVVPPVFAQSERRRIEVLGRKATIGLIHEGISVEFVYRGCDWALQAYGITLEQLERFAEGLVPLQTAVVGDCWDATTRPRQNRLYLRGCGLPRPSTHLVHVDT